MKIDCVIFDCDGLMFDTESISVENWKRVAKKHNIVIPDNFFIQIIGAGKVQFAHTVELNPWVNDIIDEVRATRIEAIHQEITRRGNINKKGLIELLTYLEENNIKKCVASSSSNSYVQNLISTIGIPFKFDAIVGGDEVKNAKPDPEVFLRAASYAGVSSEHCLVLEDSKFGTMAASFAGMHRIFIKDLVEPDEEMSESIEFEANSLLDVIDFLNK